LSASKRINASLIEIGTEVTIFQKEKKDYLSLTDIAGYKNPHKPKDVVKNWMRSKNTIEFLGLWEILNNPKFKVVEFDHFKNEAGARCQNLEL
jgi:KilA-N domain